VKSNQPLGENSLAFEYCKQFQRVTARSLGYSKFVGLIITANMVPPELIRLREIELMDLLGFPY
jgi:hypothetical protein